MIRAFQWDLARQVERLDWLLAQLPRYADWGYQELYLHLEDAVEYPSLPGVARRGAYSRRQFGRLVETASRVGLKVVPIVNLLGHTQYLIKVPELRDLNELRADDGSALERGQICPLHPRTLEIAAKLLDDMAPFCTAGKVHVGLDESFHLGKHPLSRAEIEQIGLPAHFAAHVHRLHALTRERQLRMGMWADMLYFLPEAIPLLPSELTVYEWYYHAFRRRPRVELFNFAEVDLATPLRRHGSALYGCPMNGAFRYEPLPHFSDRLGNIIAWWQHAARVGAKGFLVSSWEPNRLALELTTAIDAAAACLWLEPAVTDPAEMLARGFARVLGRRRDGSNAQALRAGRCAARIALACDRFPFAGYPRWEINERWDVLSRREPLAAYRAEARHFAALARRTKRANVPAALRASVEFRHYLAERDCLVRGLARARQSKAATVADSAFGAACKKGLRSARTMWNRTRDPRVRGPNEQMVVNDARRWRSALRRGPMFGGRWQLCYRVWNFAPAAQLVGIEQQQADGSWKTVQACHTIEFQTAAARPQGTFVREHAAPVEWNGDTRSPPRLRLFVRGIGEVKVSRVALTDGTAVHRFRQFPAAAWRRVGQAAPRSGWLHLDWTRNAAVAELQLRASQPRLGSTAR